MSLRAFFSYSVAAGCFFAAFSELHLPNVFVTLSDLLFIAAGIAAIAGNYGVGITSSGFALKVWIIAVISLCLSITLFTLLNSEASGARGVIVSAQYLFAFLYIPLLLLISSYSEVKLYTLSFVAGVTVLVGLGIFQATFDISFFGEKVVETGWDRLSALGPNPNQLGKIIVISLPLLFLNHFYRHISLQNTLLMVGVLLYGLMYTASISSLVVLLSVGALLFINPNLKVALVLMLLIGLGGMLMSEYTRYMPNAFRQRVILKMDDSIRDIGTGSERLNLYKESLGLIAKQPLFGHGANTYKSYSPIGKQVHNSYLLIWFEAGLIGLISFMAIILAGFYAVPVTHVSVDYEVYIAVLSIFLFALLCLFETHVYARTRPLPFIMTVILCSKKQI